MTGASFPTVLNNNKRLHERKTMHRVEYATSGGTNIKERGPYNATPVNNYLSGTGKVTCL
ncbi:hypothetical protein KUTeg_008952 [Tegillarca granosa]|uniref:Uncharacterized protein n=1 Tax=Tegillarca granosa TaxID=220873 RepID=A0ABQ9FAQ3_TEGGR|nr:hypothetical protein KUTeg_008952 [Tegillarca granosa]